MASRYALTKGRTARSRPANAMPLRSESVTSSRFQRRLPGGKLDRVFKPLGTDAGVARQLLVSKMSVWRWRNGRAPLPEWVSDILLEKDAEEACGARHARSEGRRAAVWSPLRPPLPSLLAKGPGEILASPSLMSAAGPTRLDTSLQP